MADITAYAQKRLSEIDFDFEQCDPESFLNWLQTHLQRKIHLIPVPTLGLGVYGRWVSMTDTNSEYIFYVENMSWLTKALTICHELAHIWEGHTTLCLSMNELDELFKTPFFLEEALARAKDHKMAYEDAVAEKMAELLVQKMVNRKPQNESVTHLISSNHFLGDYLDTMGMG